MALTGADRGAGFDGTSATSFTLSPASNCTAGAMVVLSVGADNSEAAGVAHTVYAVTDDAGNTWTRRVAGLMDPGGANSGIDAAIFTTPQDGGTLTTSSVITVSFNVATASKAWTLAEISSDSGTVDFVTGAANTGANTATPTVTTSSITSGNAVVASIFVEFGTGANQTITEDSDTTNGTWSTQQEGQGGGTGAAAQSAATQYKIVTGTGTQTYDPVMGVASDVILGWIELAEAGGGGAALSIASIMQNYRNMGLMQ